MKAIKASLIIAELSQIKVVYFIRAKNNQNKNVIMLHYVNCMINNCIYLCDLPLNQPSLNQLSKAGRRVMALMRNYHISTNLPPPRLTCSYT